MAAAALDLGSNSFLLTIAEAATDHPSGLKIHYDQAIVTGLAKGVQKGGLVTNEALERAKAVLQKYRKEIESRKVTDVKAVATEGLRKPANGQEIRKELEKSLGYPIELISGEREAQLSFKSVQNEFRNPHLSPKIVFDIGGASTELILGDQKGISDLCSLKIGSVLLSEKFGLDQVSDHKEAYAFVMDLIQKSDFFKKIPNKKAHAFGVAGTMTSLISVDSELVVYDRYAVHGKSIRRDKLEYWMKKILGMPTSERKNIVGLEPARADVFGGGLIIALALSNSFHWSQLSCADSGVRIGLLYEILGELPS